SILAIRLGTELDGTGGKMTGAPPARSTARVYLISEATAWRIPLRQRAASSSPVMLIIGRPIRRPPAHKVPLPIMVHHARARPAHRENRLHRLIPTCQESMVAFRS